MGGGEVGSSLPVCMHVCISMYVFGGQLLGHAKRYNVTGPQESDMRYLGKKEISWASVTMLRISSERFVAANTPVRSPGRVCWEE